MRVAAWMQGTGLGFRRRQIDRNPQIPLVRVQRRKGRLPVQWWEDKRAALALLVGLAVVAYAGALRNGYCLDDQSIVVDNPLVSEGRWGQIFLSD